MRVITGSARGRKLKEPVGMAIRPTTDKIKESLFNIIQFDIEGRRVLDLFAGTGQLGIEALSRGAKHAMFIDESNAAIKLVKENLGTIGFEKQSIVLQCDALGFLSTCGQFDVIFLDPPYNSSLLTKSLDRISEFDILSEGGIIVCESEADKDLPELKNPYFLRKTYKYGKTKLSVFSKSSVDMSKEA